VSGADDGGWLSVELDGDATDGARFEFNPLKRLGE